MENNETSLALIIVSFLIPIIGFILCYDYKDSHPKLAEDCMTASVVSIVFIITLVIMVNIGL